LPMHVRIYILKYVLKYSSMYFSIQVKNLWYVCMCLQATLAKSNLRSPNIIISIYYPHFWWT
jgi:hypothetical protein